MTVNTAVGSVDQVAFFRALAGRMNSSGEHYEALGFCDIDLAVIMHRPAGATFRVLLRFRDYGCDDVYEIEAGQEDLADCYVEGDLAAWEEMFDDVIAHGGASGSQTLNTLTLAGEALRVKGSDTMGIDRFFRYNQTLQDFIDGAAAVGG